MTKKLYYYCDCVEIAELNNRKISKVHRYEGKYPSQMETKVNPDQTCIHCGHYAVVTEFPRTPCSHQGRVKAGGTDKPRDKPTACKRYTKWYRKAYNANYPDPKDFAHRSIKGWNDAKLNEALKRFKDLGVPIGTPTSEVARLAAKNLPSPVSFSEIQELDNLYQSTVDLFHGG